MLALIATQRSSTERLDQRLPPLPPHFPVTTIYGLTSSHFSNFAHERSSRDSSPPPHSSPPVECTISPSPSPSCLEPTERKFALFTLSSQRRESVLALAGAANFLTSCKLKFNSRVPTTSLPAFLRTFSFLHLNVCVRAREKKRERDRDGERERKFAGVDLKKKRRSLKVIGSWEIEDVRDLGSFLRGGQKRSKVYTTREGKEDTETSSRRDCASFETRIYEIVETSYIYRSA